MKLRVIKPVIWDFLALYGLQFGNFFIPLLTFPVLARTLAPKDWAALLITQSIGIAVSTVIEYGHNITATRRIAGAKSEEEIRNTISLVYSAKILLSMVCIIILLAVLYFRLYGPVLTPSLMFSALAFGILQGALPVWYFQGRERARISASVDMIFKISAGLFMIASAIFTRRPDVVAWAQTFGVLLTWSTLTYKVYKEQSLISRLPSFNDIRIDLIQGFSVFFFRLLGSSYTSALALVLSSVISPLSSTLILTADRIAKVMPTLSVPFCQALYPRITRSKSYATFNGLKKIFLYAIAVFSVLLLSILILFLFRFEIVRLLVGTRYIFASQILSLSLWIMPAIGFNTVLFQLWIFPERKDTMANLLLLVNASVSLLWVFLMANRIALPIYAAGISASEIIVALTLLSLIINRINHLKVSGRHYVLDYFL